MSTEVTRRTVLKMLEQYLLPLIMRETLPSVVLMEPERLCQTQQDLSLHPGLPLQYGKRLQSPVLLGQWQEQQVHAIRFPCLMVVVEGEIDWRIGIMQTTEMSSSGSNYLTVPLKAGTFFLIPAGVPYSDGQGVHWERSKPRVGHATLFWMIVLPSGFLCHSCRSTATEHHSYQQFFVLCPTIYPLIRTLEQELKDETANNQVVIRAHLQIILSYVQRVLERKKTIKHGLEASLHNTVQEKSGLAHDTLQRAKSYIETHLQEPLTPTTIAAHAYLSSRHLERYFRRECGMSITDYVINRRMEAAKVLLENTNLLIRQVGEMVGYRNQSSFTQIFKRHTGASPRDYRYNPERFSRHD